jgi:hypothetical protein
MFVLVCWGTVVSWEYDPRRDPVVKVMLKVASADLDARRPENRALVLSRLEMLWRACEPHVTGVDAQGKPMFPDYRYVDLGMRIMDRLVRVLEVLKPDPPEQETVIEGRDPHAVKASRDLDAIEARLRDRGVPEA